MSHVTDTRVRRVGSFEELVSTPFADGINALCWKRTLPGDFAEVVKLLSTSVVGPGGDRALEENEGIITIQPSVLEALLAADAKPSAVSHPPSANSTDSSLVTSHSPLSAAGRTAVKILLGDLEMLRSQNRDPALNLIHAYPRDDADGPVPTDVYSFHADSAPIPADTWLCTYHGPPSEGLRNEDAVRKVDLPETRAALLKLHGGPDDESFQEFLHENHYDLHFAPKAQLSAVSGQQSAGSDSRSLVTGHSSLPNLAPAGPYSFGLFNLWRIACEYPDAPIPPCIHRAPITQLGDPPRLLLIS